MTAPTFERQPTSQQEPDVDRAAMLFLWVVPALGFVLALLGTR
jgi:hypothetical protein